MGKKRGGEKRVFSFFYLKNNMELEKERNIYKNISDQNVSGNVIYRFGSGSERSHTCIFEVSLGIKWFLGQRTLCTKGEIPDFSAARQLRGRRNVFVCPFFFVTVCVCREIWISGVRISAGNGSQQSCVKIVFFLSRQCKNEWIGFSRSFKIKKEMNGDLQMEIKLTSAHEVMGRKYFGRRLLISLF